MKKEKALELFAIWSLDGFESWESTPLYTVWDGGDFPEGSDDSEDFEVALGLLKSNYPLSSDISKLPTWCQVYLLLSSRER